MYVIKRRDVKNEVVINYQNRLKSISLVSATSVMSINIVILAIQRELCARSEQTLGFNEKRNSSF